MITKYKNGWYGPSGKYILVDGKLKNEHRLIMERYLGRKLNPQEKVKHLNGDVYDNRIKNLKIKPFFRLVKRKEAA